MKPEDKPSSVTRLPVPEIEESAMASNNEPQPQSGIMLNSGTILSGVLVLLLAGIGALNWNTSQNVTAMGRDVQHLSLNIMDYRGDAEAALERLRAEQDRVILGLRRELKVLENHHNTIWPRLRAVEQKLNMPIDRNEYENAQ